MKLRLLCLTSLLLTGFAQAQTSYSDDTGDVAVPGNPFPHIDIQSVDVTLDAGNLTFKINLAGNPVTTNWGKYLIGIRSGTGGTATGNGWGRPINFASGMTHWIGCWADGTAGGAQVWSYSGSWSQIKATTDLDTPLGLPVIDSSSFSITVPATLVNVTPGEAFTFDVYTSGGGGSDGAVDALSVTTASINNWGDTFTTTAPLVFGGLNPLGDQDGDGYTNESEENGTSTLGYVSNPLIPNYTNMNVAGDFNTWSTNAGTMTQGSTASLTTQYEWTYERRFATPATAIAFKFTTNNSFDINWGQGGSAGSVARNGNDIAGLIGASGIYRFFFDQGNLTQTLTRRTFSPGDSAAFLTAYGLSDIDANDDGDLWTNAQELAANTDPLNADTDGDGTNDDVDGEPLVQRRNITFNVDMNVQIAKGNYTVGQTVELLVFSGSMLSPNPGAGYAMSDGDADGIYTVTLSNVPGFQGQAFGNYKFYTASAPNSGYETGFDRNFTLGAPGTTQVLGTVYFSNDSTFPVQGYDDWVTGITWPEGADTSRTGNPDGDADNNLQEFLFGGSPVAANGALSTSQRDGSSLVIRYFARNEGAGYQVLENDDLAGEWTPSAGAVVSDDPDQTGVPSGHTRKLVTIPISGARNFFRIQGTETAP